MSWLRARFKSNADDYRPIYELPGNPEGPWWCSGYDGDDDAIIVAYVMSEETILKQWPEAYDVEILETLEKPTFSSRFQKPDWWKE